MTSFRNLTIGIITFLLLACSCQNKKVDSIPQLLKRLDKDSMALERIEQKYPDNIQTNFHWCDSMLQFIPQDQVVDCFDVLNLAQAYLGQFNEMLPIMKRDITYIKTQLGNLQNDIDTHYISDSLAAVYLQDEIASADTLHYRIEYFEERLSDQDKELKSLRKTISKAASK